MDNQQYFRDCYKRLHEAQEKHVEMMRAAFRGEPYDADELMASAKELSRLHVEFMDAGKPFLRLGPRVSN